MNLGFQSEHIKNGWTLRTQSNFLGVTSRQESLRFGQRREQAPRFALSDYLVQLQRSRSTFSAGNLSYRTHRHIITGFEGRGLGLTLPVGSFAAITLAGLSHADGTYLALTDHRSPAQPHPRERVIPWGPATSGGRE